MRIIDPRLGVLLPWLILVSMTAVDWAKAYKEFPTWAPSAMCLLINVIMAPIVSMALEIELTAKVGAQCFLIAVVATIGAMGASALKGKAVGSSATADPNVIAEEVFLRIQKKSCATSMQKMTKK